MDPSFYKDLSTSRGLNYRYYFSPPQDTKPTLLFLHGFPSTSYDWHNQVNFFQKEGYGLIVPDLLGYGGTAKPIEVEAYKDSLITKDLVDILDVENLTEVIAVGHDWGSKIASRLANRYPERIAAYVFIAVHYLPPSSEFDFEDALKRSKEMLGFEMIGYWKFFSEDGADQIIERNNTVGAFSQHRLYGRTSKMGDYVGANWGSEDDPFGFGGTSVWTLAHGQGTPDQIPEWIMNHSWPSSKDKEIQKTALLSGGMKAPLNWYKVVTSKIALEDERSIPKEKYNVDKPVFYAIPLRDVLSVPPRGKSITAHFCKNATIKEFDAGHWLMMEKSDELNSELLVWLEGIYT